MERGWILQKKGEYWDGIFWLLTGSIEKQLNGRSLGLMGVGQCFGDVRVYRSNAEEENCGQEMKIDICCGQSGYDYVVHEKGTYLEVNIIIASQQTGTSEENKLQLIQITEALKEHHLLLTSLINYQNQHVPLKDV